MKKLILVTVCLFSFSLFAEEVTAPIAKPAVEVKAPVVKKAKKIKKAKKAKKAKKVVAPVQAAPAK